VGCVKLVPGESLVCSYMGRPMMAALVSFPSLLGGIILHVRLACLPLAPRCKSVGDVLMLLMCSFV
jgi:hypothetical protein